MNLSVIPETAVAFLLVFGRVGTLVMMMPGIGERAILMRSRLGFALLLTLIILPGVRASLPAVSPNGAGAVGVLVGEVAVGLTIGLAVRFVMASLHVAGTVIAQQLGLSFGVTADPMSGVQNPSIANFLTILGVVMVFATDLHHVAIAAIHDSYAMLPPGGLDMIGDTAMLAVRAASRGFSVGVKVSAPFIAFALLFNLGLGVLARLMPQFQVFFLAMPATILIGMGILLATLASIMGVYLSDLESFLGELVRR